MTHSRRDFLGAAAITASTALGKVTALPSGGEDRQGGTNHSLPRIQVHQEGHYLQTEDGRPFFWLGDTAWQLIASTTVEECSYYLRTRAAQGFTVIQAVVLAEMDGIRKPSALGLRPFRDDDPAQPNEAFFDRVAQIVDEAASVGLYMALLPSWGDKLTAPWGAGPRIFTNENLPVARGYARYLAAKLRDRSNAIWMLGGDRPARIRGAESGWLHEQARTVGILEDQDWTPIWRAFAEGLAEGGGRVPLILYHPQGGAESTSALLRGEPWLSVNGMQSGHGSGHDFAVWDLIARDYAIAPPKPTLDLEPNYEDHPYNPWPSWDPATGYFRDYDVRKQIYRSVFAGACGVTYGHHAVWQFANARNGVINHADRDWIDAMQRPAGRQAVFLRRLLESRPYFSRVPDQGILASGQGTGGDHAQAMRDRDGGYLLVYFPRNDQTATLDISSLSGSERGAWWYDPRTGIGTRLQQSFAGARVQVTTPPYGPDWILVVEDAARRFAFPGTFSQAAVSEFPPSNAKGAGR